jgi:hypothetical protein
MKFTTDRSVCWKPSFVLDSIALLPSRRPDAIGLQIIGKRFDEETVLRIADALERSTQWHLKDPKIAI